MNLLKKESQEIRASNSCTNFLLFQEMLKKKVADYPIINVVDMGLPRRVALHSADPLLSFKFLHVP